MRVEATNTLFIFLVQISRRHFEFMKQNKAEKTEAQQNTNDKKNVWSHNGHIVLPENGLLTSSQFI